MANVAALMGLTGIVISAIISLFLSRSVATNEIKKVRLEIKKTYEARLIEERLKRYPGLFSLLSNFIKDIEFRSISKATVLSLLAAINDWDSQNAIFFSWSAAVTCYNFRQYLSKLLRETEIDVILSSASQGEELRKKTAEVEFALRSDIGIYGIESSAEGDFALRFVDSYPELEEMIQLRALKRDLSRARVDSRATEH